MAAIVVWHHAGEIEATNYGVSAVFDHRDDEIKISSKYAHSGCRISPWASDLSCKGGERAPLSRRTLRERQILSAPPLWNFKNTILKLFLNVLIKAP